MSTAAIPLVPHRARQQPVPALIAAAIKTLYAFCSCPSIIFLATLTAMLFRPPDLKTFPVDRLAFIVLIACVAMQIVLRRERLNVYPATWPMFALLLLGLRGVLAQSYSAEAWSLLAAKWIVPLTMFHLAGIVFRDGRTLRQLEVFSLVVLVYLSAISILFLFDFKSFIFPKFILDENIGIHADRARGPFLQAVANGVCLNILGLVALHSYAIRRLRGLLALMLFFAVPLAILATRTRAVWFSASVTAGLIAWFGPGRRLRQVGAAFCLMSVLGASAFLLYSTHTDLTDRLADRSPVDFRLDMYRAGWQMFTEKPLKGWGSEARIQPEIARRISSFHPEYFLFHNTYLELAVERGLLGLSLYAWWMIEMFRLRKCTPTPAPRSTDLFGSEFRKLWPVIVLVYLINASAVVMNYQFVNGLFCTFAGILAAQNTRAKSPASWSVS